MSEPARSRHRFTYGEYLAHEEASTDKHEFLEGDIYAMAGGTPEHAALAVAISTLLANAAGDGPCRVFSSDLRVRVLSTGLAAYPDVTVVCGSIERDPASRVTITNPTLIVEVSSDATEEWDRGEKLDHYKKIPSLRECLIVSHREPGIELWRRDADGGWACERVRGEESIYLESVDCALPVGETYRRAAIT